MDLSHNRRMRPSLGMAVALILGLIAPGPAPSAAQGSLTVPPAGVVTWDEIVRRDAVQPPAESAPQAVPFMPVSPGREIGAAPGPRSPAALAPVTPPPTLPQPNGPAIATNFAALGDNNTAIPPDTMGVAGPSHLMTMLNSQVRIQDKGGGGISTVSLSSFWTAGTGLTGSVFDPHVVYDALSGRWLATVFANGNSSTSKVFFAISATSNPTGTWTFYGFTADTGGTTWADYPGFGVNNTWVPITANMFTVATMPAFVAAKMWVIDKATALAGGTLTVTVFAPGFDSAGGASGFTLEPALTYSAAEPTLYIVDNSGFSSGGTQLVRLSQITGTGPAPAWSVVPGSSFAGSGLFFVTNNFDFTQIGAAQAGTTTTVETNDPRASASVFRNGRLWFAHAGGLPVGAVDRTAVFWYQLNPATMPTPIVQSGVFDGGAGVHHFFPSITANSANDALIGFSRSDATKFVEAVTAGRFGTDAPGTMMAPSVLKAGEGCYVKTFGKMVNRWGDYSATSIDPTDDLTFWTVQEYAATPSPATSCADGSGRWGTWWGTTKAVTTTTTTTTSSTTSSTTTTTTTTTSTTTTTTTIGPTTTTTTIGPTTTTTTLPPLCGATPATGCRLGAAGGSSALLKENADATKDQFKWKWAKGAATAVTDFKDPVGGSATYRVCLYDGSTHSQPLMEMDVPPGGTCGTKPCWKASGTTGFSYKNKAGTATGLTAMKLKAGVAGKAQVQARGKGANLPMPTLGLTLPVTVQLLIKTGTSTECWQTTFTVQKTNSSTQFSAKGP